MPVTISEMNSGIGVCEFISEQARKVGRATASLAVTNVLVEFIVLSRLEASWMSLSKEQ